MSKLINTSNIDEFNTYRNNDFDYTIFMTNSCVYSDWYIMDMLLLLHYSEYNIITKPLQINLEYQVDKKPEPNLINIFSTIVKKNTNYTIKNKNILFDGDVKVLYSDRFGFYNNFKNVCHVININEYKFIPKIVI